MGEKEVLRITLTLNLKTPLHRQVWAVLKDIQNGKRTEFICKRIVGQQDMQEMAKIVYDNALKALSEYGVSISNDTKTDINMEKADEIDRNFFGFLASLE